MTLLITVFAAVISTVVWYTRKDDAMKLGFLCLMYWGASLMWLVDAIVEFVSEGVSYFEPASDAMINDAFLGFSVVALGLIIWLVRLLVTDPKGRIFKTLQAKRQ